MYANNKFNTVSEENHQSISQTKQCPKCKESIKKDALICWHCKTKLDLPSKMIHFGNNLIGCGCALTLLVVVIIFLIGIL